MTYYGVARALPEGYAAYFKDQTEEKWRIWEKGRETIVGECSFLAESVDTPLTADLLITLPPDYPKDYMYSADDYLLKIRSSSSNKYCFTTLVGDFNIYMYWIDGEQLNWKGTLPSLLIDSMNSCGLT